MRSTQRLNRADCPAMTTFAETPPPASAASPSRTPWVRLGLASLFAVGIAVVGYGWGSHRSGVTELHGFIAHSSPDQISVQAGGVTYNVPLVTPWKDRDGAWHMGERPTCLPPGSDRRSVTFGAVRWERDDYSSYTVAWVECSH